MFSINLAIKFGSNEIIIYRKGFGIIAKEPAYLAVIEHDNKLKVKATGKEAEKMFLSKSSSVTVYEPIKNSEIINEKMAVILINEILKNVIPDKFLLTRLTALVAVPCALNQKQLTLLKRVLNEAGVTKAEFVQNSVCARTELDIDSHAHLMVVDIGKYITDISVLNEYNFDMGKMYFIGGEDMDKSITTFIADNHGLTVSDQTSEAIKNEVASLYERDFYKTEYIGIDDNDKFVKRDITANEVRLAVTNVYDKIINLIKENLNRLPKDIAKDIYTTGVLFVGGGSTIAGLYEYASKKLDVPVIVAENPADTVILGAGKLLNGNREFLKLSF